METRRQVDALKERVRALHPGDQFDLLLGAVSASALIDDHARDTGKHPKTAYVHWRRARAELAFEIGYLTPLFEAIEAGDTDEIVRQRRLARRFGAEVLGVQRRSGIEALRALTV